MHFGKDRDFRSESETGVLKEGTSRTEGRCEFPRGVEIGVKWGAGAESGEQLNGARRHARSSRLVIILVFFFVGLQLVFLQAREVLPLDLHVYGWRLGFSTKKLQY